MPQAGPVRIVQRAIEATASPYCGILLSVPSAQFPIEKAAVGPVAVFLAHGKRVGLQRNLEYSVPDT
jgi:hypothetical protein